MQKSRPRKRPAVYILNAWHHVNWQTGYAVYLLVVLRVNDISFLYVFLEFKKCFWLVFHENAKSFSLFFPEIAKCFEFCLETLALPQMDCLDENYLVEKLFFY